MLKTLTAAVALVSSLTLPVHAFSSSQNTAGATGAQARMSARTGGSTGWTHPTGKQSIPLPRASSGQLARTFGTLPVGLPPTRLDSFVQEAGGLADQIYGDEGTSGPPPIQDFNPINRIDMGISTSASNFGLTTGHESVLPSAWGGDEFSSKAEPPIVSGDHILRNGLGLPIPGGLPFDPMSAMPGGLPGGGYFDPSAGVFPGAGGR